MTQACDPNWYRHVLGHYPTGVAVVSASDAQENRIGLTVGSFTSVSLSPPLIAFFPSKNSSSWPRILEIGHFCINVLAVDQENVCRKLAAQGKDKFTDIKYRLSERGDPVIKDCVISLDCDLQSVHEAGDHYNVLGLVKSLQIESTKKPLLFLRGGYGSFFPLGETV